MINLNKEIKDAVSVLNCIRFFDSFPSFEIDERNDFKFNLNQKEKTSEDYFHSYLSIAKMINISENKLRSTVAMLIKREFIEKSANDSYKITEQGLHYLEYKVFKQDQLKYTTNNPIRKIQNVSIILSPIIAILMLLVSMKNCSRLDDLEDKNSSKTVLKTTQDNELRKQTKIIPITADSLSINNENFTFKNLK